MASVDQQFMLEIMNIMRYIHQISNTSKIHNGLTHRFQIKGMLTMQTIKKITFYKSKKIMISQ